MRGFTIGDEVSLAPPQLCVVPSLCPAPKQRLASTICLAPSFAPSLSCPAPSPCPPTPVLKECYSYATLLRSQYYGTFLRSLYPLFQARWA